MAVQFTDFSRAPLIDSPWNNIFQKVMQGYQMGRMPAQLRQEEQAKNLANQMSQLRLEQAPQEFGSMQQQRDLANQLASLKLQQAPQEFQTSQAGAQLMNALRQSQLKYADPEAQARLGLLASQQQSAAANAQRILAQLEQEKAFRDMFSQATGGGQAAGLAPGQQGISGEAQFPGAQASAAQQAAKAQAPSNAVVASAGNPSMYNVDQLYDQNPLSRAFLEKQGFKKTQSIQRDPATGATNVITTFPSGKVTIQESPKVESEFSAPTRSTISDNQAILRGIDNTIPVIDKLKKMEAPSAVFGSYTSPTKMAEYNAMTGAVTDTLVSAMGLPKTNESISLVKQMITRQKGESQEGYKQRLDKLREELIDRKKISMQQLKQGNKIIEKEEKAAKAETADQAKPAGKFDFSQYSVYGGGQ